MAAPLAMSSDGLIAVGSVEGARIRVVCGKIDATFDAILGVCDVPPERMTFDG